MFSKTHETSKIYMQKTYNNKLLIPNPNEEMTAQSTGITAEIISPWSIQNYSLSLLVILVSSWLKLIITEQKITSSIPITSLILSFSPRNITIQKLVSISANY